MMNKLVEYCWKMNMPYSYKPVLIAVMYLSNMAAITKAGSELSITISIDSKDNYQSNRSYILNRIKSCIIQLLRSPLSICF